MRPMLASAVRTLPSGDGWAFEFKWDGVRVLLDASERGVRLDSRAGNDVSGGYPEIVAVGGGIGDALLDGEIVAFVDGRPSFDRLQNRMHVRGKADVARLAAEQPVTFVVFDVLRRFGVDLTPRPYAQRRATLDRFAAEHPDWTVSPSFDDGPATEAVARQHGLEGVIAKRVDSAYRPGERSDAWRKLRFVRAGDFAVVGWEAAPEHPATLSSLVLATHTDDGLVYVGRVGSGLSGRLAAGMKSSLLVRESAAIEGIPAPLKRRRTYWVEPEVVVEVEFLNWTDDHRLRNPVFRGIRADKTVEQARGDG